MPPGSKDGAEGVQSSKPTSAGGSGGLRSRLTALFVQSVTSEWQPRLQVINLNQPIITPNRQINCYLSKIARCGGFAD